MHPIFPYFYSDLRLLLNFYTYLIVKPYKKDLMNIDEIKDEHYYRVIPDEFYWSPTIQRQVKIGRMSDNLIVKVISHCDDPCLPLIFGSVVNTFPNHSPRDTKFELALLAEDLIEECFPSVPQECRPNCILDFGKR